MTPQEQEDFDRWQQHREEERDYFGDDGYN
jgi:hypothetical protein